MRRSIRGALVSAGAIAFLVAQPGVDAAGTVQEVNTPAYQACPGVISPGTPAPPSFTWTASFACKADVAVNLGGRWASAKGTVTGSYSQWSTSSTEPCANGSSFTVTVGLTYTDKKGSISFSVPMKVFGSSNSNNGTTENWCYSEYNSTYTTAQPVSSTGRYAMLNEMCTFELGIQSNGPGSTLFFAADDNAGTANACFPSA